MRTSASRWLDGPAQGADGDERGVSEVIGYLLIFGILSIVLVLSMVAFNVLHDRAEDNVVRLQAGSVAQRVAASAVDAALFAESHDPDTSTYIHPLGLPEDLEGHGYHVHLEAENTGSGDPDDCLPCPSPASCTRPEQVRVCVPHLGNEDPITAPLFSAGAGGAAAGFTLCASDAPGGDVGVRFGPDPSDPTSYCVFLEAI